MKEVTAYADQSGGLWLNELDALKSDAKISLAKILGQNADVCITAIMGQPQLIHKALDDLVTKLNYIHVATKPCDETRYPAIAGSPDIS